MHSASHKPPLIKQSRKHLQCMAASLSYLCGYLPISEPHSLQSCLRLHSNCPKQTLLEHGATGRQIHMSPANYARITDFSMVGQEGSYLWCTRRASVMSNLLSSALPCTPPPCKRRVLPTGQQCLTKLMLLISQQCLAKLMLPISQQCVAWLMLPRSQQKSASLAKRVPSPSQQC